MEAGPPPGGIWGLALGEIDQETHQRMLTALKSSGGRKSWPSRTGGQSDARGDVAPGRHRHRLVVVIVRRNAHHR
jgi:hypothetical protein